VEYRPPVSKAVVEGGRLVVHGEAERGGQCFGDVVVVLLDRAVEGVGLAVVGFGVEQDRHDRAGLVDSGDRGVTAFLAYALAWAKNVTKYGPLAWALKALTSA